ncbi:MAG TPA: flagellar biosynthetic protein FliQ [Candidatus Acidoferrales bacterium]|jgi:flagellar biosynthetic protein FliQ|nr:flagellar biosynthetic protein FliQ [Candidatus Acidoferrales bacterium]
MPAAQVIDVCRHTLLEVLLLAAPILLIAVAVSLLVNIVQVLTSLQEVTISAVPRLLAVAAGTFFMMPWMWRQICQYTVSLLSDFHPYVR